MMFWNCVSQTPEFATLGLLVTYILLITSSAFMYVSHSALCTRERTNGQAMEGI